MQEIRRTFTLSTFKQVLRELHKEEKLSESKQAAADAKGDKQNEEVGGDVEILNQNNKTMKKANKNSLSTINICRATDSQKSLKQVININDANKRN